MKSNDLYNFTNRVVASKTARVGAVLVAIAIISVLYLIPWSGFGSYTNSKGEVQRYKTLWDWIQLLIVPLVAAGAAAWFTHWREQLNREIEEKREQLNREIEEDRKREARLETYFDRMTELMLNKGLCNPESGAEVRDIARARTLTVLQGLDGARKGTLLRFLKESNLINKVNPIISLHTMHLDKAQLRWADLSNANLSGAVFAGAELRDAHLERADLSNAYLGGEADLCRANLSQANLKGAIFTGEDQSGADLDGARLDEADIRGADFRRARNLKPNQISSALSDEATKLPEKLDCPKHLD